MAGKKTRREAELDKERWWCELRRILRTPMVFWYVFFVVVPVVAVPVVGVVAVPVVPGVGVGVGVVVVGVGARAGVEAVS